MAVFPHGMAVKMVAIENAECLETLENHYPQWLLSKKVNVRRVFKSFFFFSFFSSILIQGVKNYS